jgi:hypothetical protein
LLISLLQDYDEAAEKASALAVTNGRFGYHRLYAAVHTKVAKAAKSWGYGCCTAAKSCPQNGETAASHPPLSRPVYDRDVLQQQACTPMSMTARAGCRLRRQERATKQAEKPKAEP